MTKRKPLRVLAQASTILPGFILVVPERGRVQLARSVSHVRQIVEGYGNDRVIEVYWQGVRP
jgi:hypothetical protein